MGTMDEHLEAVYRLEDAAGMILHLLVNHPVIQADGGYVMTAELSDALGELQAALDARTAESESES